MPLQPLDSLARSGSLEEAPPDAIEIAALMSSGETRLRDAQNDSLEPESRFDLAYNAGYAIALAALRFHGYRSGEPLVVFQTLEHTVDLTPEQCRILTAAQKKWDAVFIDVDAKLVEAVIRIIDEVSRRLRAMTAEPS